MPSLTMGTEALLTVRRARDPAAGSWRSSLAQGPLGAELPLPSGPECWGATGRCLVFSVPFGMGRWSVNSLTSRDRVPRKAAF